MVVAVNLLLCFLTLVRSSIDLNDLSYVVQIHSSPYVPESQDRFPYDLSAPMPMTAANGRQFNCFLPGDKSTQTNTNPSETLLEFGRKAVLKVKTCVEWKDDSDELKTFEICPNVVVRAVHSKPHSKSVEIEEIGKIVGDVVTDASKSYSRFNNPAFADEIKAVSSKQPLFSQRFGRQNGAIVQYLCGKKDEVVGYGYDASTKETSFLVAGPAFCAESSTPTSEMQEILKPLDSVCIKKNEGWWTYEFCFGKQLKQYHREQNGEITINFSLGDYDHAGNAELEKLNQDFTTEYLDAASHDRAKVAFVQTYSGGTSCHDEVDGKLRSTRVLLYCNTASPNHFIMSVKEVATCTYELKVSTPTVCTHPNFADEFRQSRDNALAVHCVPADQAIV